MRTLAILLLVSAALVPQMRAQNPAPAQPQSTPAQPKAPPDTRPGMDLVRQARQQSGQGKLDEAVTLYRQALEQNPKLVEAELGMGSALDLKGDYDEARKHIANAIELASPQQRVQALRQMGISYAFQRKAAEAEKYDTQAFDLQMAAKDFVGAAEVANELARILLESGDINGAEKWYHKGYETALQKPDLTSQDRDLWNFRWEHAAARIAARRGNKSEAQKHMTAAKGILDKGAITQDQARFFPYLEGYVAFYGGDYKAAIDALQKADQRDPFILSLLAQAYEKSGNKDQATELYRKILTMNIHNPTGAFARPLAKQKLGG